MVPIELWHWLAFPCSPICPGSAECAPCSRFQRGLTFGRFSILKEGNVKDAIFHAFASWNSRLGFCRNRLGPLVFRTRRIVCGLSESERSGRGEARPGDSDMPRRDSQMQGALQGRQQVLRRDRRLEPISNRYLQLDQRPLQAAASLSLAQRRYRNVRTARSDFIHEARR
jgi:hypothetical protein